VFLYNVNADNEPISQIDGEAYQINGSTQSMAKLEFADAEIEFDPITEGNVAVVMCEDGQDGPPAIAADGNGLDHADRNWVYGDIGTGSMHWYNAADLGVPGDWIMRLGIETDNIESDADTDADADADADADSDSDTDTDADAGELKLFAISPANAKVGEAINVVVSGAGFVQGAQVHIGGASLVGATVQDDGTISGRTPTTLPAGVHDVDVVNPDGTSAYLAGAFTVEGGCGCATTPVPAGAWAAATLVGLVVTRRRKSN
jgi:MYXO-CTERM domain-containing protein